MASFFLAAADAAEGLSGAAVRGAVDAPAAAGASEAVTLAGASSETALTSASALAEAGRTLLHGLEAAGRVAGEATAAAGKDTVAALGQPAFSWSNYIQAVGILFLLLAGLWLGVWLLRRYGKFNFLPRPGALPRGALVMEAQMPLGPRKGLMVVRFLNRRLLLGVTDRQITLLTEESVHNEPNSGNFHELMEAAQSGESTRSAAAGSDSPPA